MKSFSCHISLTLLSVYSSSTFKDFIIRLGPSGSFRVISPPQGYLISNFKCMYHFNFLLSCNIISTQIQRIKTWLSLGAIILPTIFGLLDWNFSYIVRFISHEPGSFHFYFLVVANAFYILKLSTWSCWRPPQSYDSKLPFSQIFPPNNGLVSQHSNARYKESCLSIPSPNILLHFL